MQPSISRKAPLRAPQRRKSSGDALSGLWAICLTAFIVAVLYVGKDILIPMALAALLTFLLAPAVTRLERWLGRIGAVILVMLMIVGGTIAAGWTLGRQAVDLANQMPSYKDNIQVKMQSLQVPKDGPWSRLSGVIDDLKKDAPGGANKEAADAKLASNAKDAKGGKEAIPVEVVQTPDTTPFQIAKSLAAPVLGPLGTTGLVLLLLVFMLLKREDLRGRLVRLIGQGRISSTTKVMDDAGERIRRYLLMQLVVNVTYGIPLAIGLYFIGVPNALLWGVVAAVLRFIPYIGPWIAAFFPITLSLAVSPSWSTPFLTIGLFVVIELISNNLLEPWLYGSSTGVSSIALIIAAVFWTWMWGSVGLVLATPITVCLVVMGRHIPQLAFLSILLSEEEALTPAEDCYHRMLRHAEHDETELVDSFLKSKSPTELYDTVLIPVVLAAERDHRQGMLDSEQKDRVLHSLSEVVDDLAERYALSAMETQPDEAEIPEPPGYPLHVQILPARAERDVLAGSMLAQALSQKGFVSRNASGRKITSEMIASLESDPHDLVCISVVDPSNAIQARTLVTKIRRAVPDQRIIVGFWGRSDDLEEVAKSLYEAGAEEIFRSIADLVSFCERLSLQYNEKTKPAPIPEDEDERQSTLEHLGLLNEEREPTLDHITAKLAKVFDVPTVAITLLDRDRQFFKANTGLPAEMDEERETPRDLSVCGHVVAADGLLVVPDLKRDRRFAGNPLLNKHGLRFYAGVPIHAVNGQPIGALCLMDTSPRRFTKQEARLLLANAEEIGEEIERLAGATIPD
ncbi:MAG: putative phytochrome sensor protein [Akkermansiaceae bacterium]|nr:putative phytochrome sensor protein [Akkermansiaceae bacterium]